MGANTLTFNRRIFTLCPIPGDHPALRPQNSCPPSLGPMTSPPRHSLLPVRSYNSHFKPGRLPHKVVGLLGTYLDQLSVIFNNWGSEREMHIKGGFGEKRNQPTGRWTNFQHLPQEGNLQGLAHHSPAPFTSLSASVSTLIHDL